MISRNRAIFELFVAALIWGFAFIAIIWLLEFLDFRAVIFYRFAVAFLVGIIILLWRRTSKEILLREFKASFIAGVMLSSTLLLQTYGLKLISASESAFITVLYVVIVPVIEKFFLKRRLRYLHWFAVLIALSGVYLITGGSDKVWGLGEMLTLGCAVFASFHILVVGRIAAETDSPFAFNVFQSFWIALFALLLSRGPGSWDLSLLNLRAWFSLALLALGASLIAFYLQIRAQKRISNSLASVLFLLESPFSLFFSYLLLGERLRPSQSMGAALIFVACIFAINARSKVIAAQVS